MGTDIHMRAEVRKGDHWEPVGPVFDSSWDEGHKTSQPYENRNYDVFAILGNVRNGTGFAGVPTGSGFVPLTDKRGLPDDVSDEVREFVTDEYGDRHSISWAGLDELLAYDWDRVTVKSGVFSEREYIAALRGIPAGYAAGVSGGSVEVVSEDEYLDLLADMWHRDAKRDPTKTYYIRREWETTYRETADGFYSHAMPALQALADDPSDVRIVFSFDS